MMASLRQTAYGKARTTPIPVVKAKAMAANADTAADTEDANANLAANRDAWQQAATVALAKMKKSR